MAIENPLETCEGSHAAIVATEWGEIRALDLDDFAKRLAWPAAIDGRNVFDADRAEQAGLRYRCIGRREVDGHDELRGARGTSG